MTEQEDVGRLLASIFVSGRVVDLSVPLAEDLPCTWPGHMPFRATVWSWFEDRPADPQPVRPAVRGSYQTRWLVMDEHTGTHLDAPRHFIPPPGSGMPHAGPGGDIGVDRFPLTAAAGRASVVDVTGLVGTAENGVSPPVRPEHLLAWEEVNGRLEPRDVVLLRADWDERYRRGPAGDAYGAGPLTGAGPAWPALTPEAVLFLHERGVRCVGSDAPSVGAAEDIGPVHHAGLSRGMAFVEALSGLCQLPARGAWFLFLPIRVWHGTGAPGRALAVLP
jgi:isatin hydrolase